MNGAIRLKQFTARPNAGDAASAVIVSELGGEEVLVVGEEPCGAPNLIAIGSILHWADPNSVIWGTGLIHEGVPLIPPRALYAVRGRLTRDVLHAQGVICPEMFGDPAILMPRVRPRRDARTAEIGFVPHYVDLDSDFVKRARAAGVPIIDPLQPLDDYLLQLGACRNIISSSLHGIIFAHAYGIPAAWLRLSDRILGNGFKFRDYYSSIGFQPGDTPCFGPKEQLGRIANNCHLPVTVIDSAALIEAFTSALHELRRNGNVSRKNGPFRA